MLKKKMCAAVLMLAVILSLCACFGFDDSNSDVFVYADGITLSETEYTSAFTEITVVTTIDTEKQRMAESVAEESCRVAEESRRVAEESCRVAEESRRIAEEQSRAESEAEESRRIADEQSRAESEAEESRRVADEQSRAESEAEESRRVADEQSRAESEAEESRRIAEEQSKAESEAEGSSRQSERADNTGDGVTVYKTPTGKRYHYDPDCGGKNSTPTTLEEAIAIGLTPCKKCAQ